MRVRVALAVVLGLMLLGGAFAAWGQPLIADKPKPTSVELQAPSRVAAMPKVAGPEPRTLGPGAAAAKATAQRMAQESASVLGSAKPSTVVAGDLDHVAMGPALAELVAQAESNAHQDVTQTGTAKVVWVKVDPAKSSGTTMTAAVCLDNSDVVLRDARGASVPTSSHPRTINLYVFRKHAGTWKVAEHSFPTNPDC